MNTALLLAHPFWQRLLPPNRGSGRPATTPRPCAVDISGPVGVRAGRPAPARPLRIVRILEHGQTPAQAGRLRISGRLADVCAELDRLAASEAAAAAKN